ncbi:MAG: L-histidine N(alpha)-methyltransferase [Hyphomicrobiaceae bacterium]
MNVCAGRQVDQRESYDPEFAAAILHGLSQPQKSLPSRYLYDAEGSALFEEITRLVEYYPSRTETAILSENAAEIANGTGRGTALIELGSGSSRKTEILIDVMPELEVYVAIDVSTAALDEARSRLAARHPLLDTRGIVADFSRLPPFPEDVRRHDKLGFFPGSTIGNLDREQAVNLLSDARAMLAPRGRFIVGVDLVKDRATLLRAYNDADGVTAAFNLNLLARVNREFDAAFDLDEFAHRAVYDEARRRIEMHLVSLRDQTVGVLGHAFRFRAGETIHTENSHKYTIDDFSVLARRAGWRHARVWTDADRLFSLHELVER